MPDAKQRTKVLITVMTYPHPSEKYTELICTAGITEANEWVRLYPIDYRYRPPEQRFRKYQWIEVVLGPRGAGNDERAESRKPDLDSIRLLGPQIPASRNWIERRAIIDRMPVFTRNQLSDQHEADKAAKRPPVSLGIVRPTKIVDVIVEDVPGEWKSEWKATLAQGLLFGDAPKEIKKLPFTWKYVFECSDSDGKPHTAMNEDWEIGVLYWKELERLGSPEKAAEAVRRKCLQLVAQDRDSRFFMGTVFPYNTWIVLGVFWPAKETQARLGAW
jgi:hypothetical protein